MVQHVCYWHKHIALLTVCEYMWMDIYEKYISVCIYEKYISVCIHINGKLLLISKEWNYKFLCYVFSLPISTAKFLVVTKVLAHRMKIYPASTAAINTSYRNRTEYYPTETQMFLIWKISWRKIIHTTFLSSISWIKYDPCKCSVTSNEDQNRGTWSNSNGKWL